LTFLKASAAITGAPVRDDSGLKQMWEENDETEEAVSQIRAGGADLTFAPPLAANPKSE